MANKWFFKEVRKINAYDLETLIVKNGWYTNGTSSQRYRLEMKAEMKANITTDDLCDIAQDIINHSDLLADDFAVVWHEVRRIAKVLLIEEK